MENGSPDEGIEREKRGRRVINPTESKLLEKKKSQGRLLPKTPRSISVLVYAGQQTTLFQREMTMGQSLAFTCENSVSMACRDLSMRSWEGGHLTVLVGDMGGT